MKLIMPFRCISAYYYVGLITAQSLSTVRPESPRMSLLEKSITSRPPYLEVVCIARNGGGSDIHIQMLAHCASSYMLYKRFCWFSCPQSPHADLLFRPLIRVVVRHACRFSCGRGQFISRFVRSFCPRDSLRWLACPFIHGQLFGMLTPEMHQAMQIVRS